MIKFEYTQVFGWETAIRGMRNPMNSWEKSDSLFDGNKWCLGDNDFKLMKNLVKAGSDHRKFMRMINVTVDITAPLYWWKGFDTYKVGTVANSCSTMHKIHEKSFNVNDFSHEHVEDLSPVDYNTLYDLIFKTIDTLNYYREKYLETKDKLYWWQMIQILPSSYNQKRTIQMNYEVLINIYHARKDHKLDEWRVGFIDWIKSLPYSELITGEEKNDDGH